MVSNEISQEAYKELGKDTTNLPPNGNYEIVSEHNIGYFTGSANSSKINGKSFNNTIGNNDLTISNGEITGFKIYTKKSEISGDKQEVTNLDSNIKTKMVDILNDSSKIIKGFRLNKQVSNNNPIKGFKINGKASCLPSSAIWFVPKEDGIAKIIVDACNESGSNGFFLYQIIRKGPIDKTNPFANDITGVQKINTVYKDSNGQIYYVDSNSKIFYIDSNGQICDTGSYYKEINGKPYYIDSNNQEHPINNIYYKYMYTKDLAEKTLYYFEIPVKAGIEYALGGEGSNSPYLLYLDLGQNGGSSNKNGEIHDCDFVKAGIDGKLIKIRNNTNYTESGVLISFVAPTSTLIIYFNRVDKEGKDIVIYLVDPTDSLNINPKVGKNNAIPSTEKTDFSA